MYKLVAAILVGNGVGGRMATAPHYTSTVTVEPGSSPDHDKLGEELDKVKCLLREEALTGLAKMALNPIISEPMPLEPV